MLHEPHKFEVCRKSEGIQEVLEGGVNSRLNSHHEGGAYIDNQVSASVMSNQYWM